jgi:hypothetical protein
MGIESKFANKIVARIASKLGVSESAPGTVWILATGVWNDLGFWDDFSNWID